MNLEDLKNYTPLFRALQEERYLRRDYLQAIRDVFRVSGVISYISPSAPIDEVDPIVFEDLLYRIGSRKVNSILLILHSNGGVPDVAEKIVETIRDKARRFYIVVPERAKSSATLLSLGSDRIYMLESAELGPIDPQLKINTPSGGQWRPAQSIINGFYTALEVVSENKDKLGSVGAILLQMIDTTTLDLAKRAVDHAKAIAKKLLESYMLKDPRKAEDIATRLANAEEFLSHGRPIRWQYAKEIGLKVALVRRGTDKYELVWRYFVNSLLFLSRTNLRKLFESDTGVSLVF